MAQQRRKPEGYRHHGMKRIVVSFDEETFDDIVRRAAAKRRSFAEQVRTLVEFGLEDEEVTP